MSKTAVLRLVETPVPSAVSETSPRKGVTNEDRRPREHLSRDEVMVLVKAARANRNGARDAAAIDHHATVVLRLDPRTLRYQADTEGVAGSGILSGGALPFPANPDTAAPLSLLQPGSVQANA